MYYDSCTRLINLSPQQEDNIITLGNVFYSLDFLDRNKKVISGGNGVVYQATSSDNNEDYVVKICKYSYEEGKTNKWIQKRIDRFEREIEALNIASEEGLENVIKIIDNETLIVDSLSFRYFIMEKCDNNLGGYLEGHKDDITNSQKLLLFYKILEGIKQLNSFKIYHRDIKIDNILFLGSNPKIADLGLVYYQNSDFQIYEKGEKIGPFGWLSPEATNKFLVERSSNPHKHDCKIDSKSDVFQLGKLCWYIFNGNIPLGQILQGDFAIKDKLLYDIIFDSLQYSKKRRMTIEVFLKRIKELFHAYNL